ncbi:hypothetical protein FHR34_004620 [Kitasatospora kifunensis]|uniref:Uncharacterized protein n=1 Tax=Kitasatospora kifunensis TaxID=58351 RepID=A0A7W7R555_KITKI|nr:hypothetical protein [Kitasatospora kifunensis]
MRWVSPAPPRTGCSSWPLAGFVEQSTPQTFFGNPRSQRAKEFLAAVLGR